MNTQSGHITPDILTRAFQTMWDTPLPTPRIVVHPDEAAWIKNPIGPAPTAFAVDLALGFGTIDAQHPEARRLMSTLNGDGPHLIGDRVWTSST